MRHTRSHKRQHEPNETPRHSATHTHLRGSSNDPLTALDPPISLPQASAAIGVHFNCLPTQRTLATLGSPSAHLRPTSGSSFCSSFANRIYKTACAIDTLHTKSQTSLKKPPHAGSALHAGTLIPIILRPKAWPKAQVSRTGYTKPHVLSKHFIHNLVQVCKNHHMPAVRCTPASLFLFMYSPEIPKSRSRAFGQAFGQAQGKGKIPQQQTETGWRPRPLRRRAERPRLSRGATAGPRQRGVSPGGGGGGEEAAPPADRVQGGGGSKGLISSLHITQPNSRNMLCLYKSACPCVPWLLGWF